MNPEKIDYEALKKQGFLRSKDDQYFTLRTRATSGNYKAAQFKKLSEIADKYGKGFVHLTVRQGTEIPFIKYEDIKAVESEIKSADIEPGTSGARLRAITSCPGSNWCKRGLVDTFAIFDKLEKERGIKCSMDLPHKFKIAISGCPNKCTRAEAAEIGLHGQVDLSDPEKRRGYAVYIGGSGGKTPRIGYKLDKVYTEEEALSLVGKVVDFYKKNAKPRQKLALFVEEIGIELFLKKIGE